MAFRFILSSFVAHVISLVFIGSIFLSCNKDDIIESEVQKPGIVLDSVDGIYSVKQGNTLTISPEFANCENAKISWMMGGEIVCTSASWSKTWDNPVGNYYITINAKNEAGTATEEIRVDVLTLTPPVISLAIPEQGFMVETNTDYVLSPDIQHSDLEGFKIGWYLNDVLVCDSVSYTFNQSVPGIYNICIKAENCDGKAEKSFTVTVYETMPIIVKFPKPSYRIESTTRYTFPNRAVILRPELQSDNILSYRWQIDGVDVPCKEREFTFTPTAPGEYTATVTVANSESYATASVKIVCVDATEQSRMRPQSATSSLCANRTFEYTPAPGQFIGEILPGDKSASLISTAEEACAWAQKRLNEGKHVSLGSFGGYIVVGFDHSIPVSSLEYDFVIQGNPTETSNEPGIVWVMQDVNGNGLPDDEWYQLIGSEYDNQFTKQFYSVTYYRPAPSSNVLWTDSEGSQGYVPYVPEFHNQSSYYPAWVTEDAYTLYGTCIGSRNYESPTGFWDNKPYPWGYVDNMGSDTAYGYPQGCTGFKISNAIDITGKPVSLMYIDFIKVQTAVLAKSGSLGEISTEVLSFRQYTTPQ